MPHRSLIIIADTNVLINFLHINRMDLIANHSHRFVITDHVRGEVTDYYPTQQQRLQQAIEQGVLTERQLISMEERELFKQCMKSGRIGAGESSAIACAIHGSHRLAMDDKRAIKEAKRIAEHLEIIKTQELVISMIKEQLLSIAEADGIKEVWEAQYKFRLKIGSFREVVET